jgi:hypothetical protein
VFNDLVGHLTFEMGAGSAGLLALATLRRSGTATSFRPFLADLDRIGRWRLG